MERFMVHHLARCGSHAIIDWIMRSMANDGINVVHYNNVNQYLKPRNRSRYTGGDKAATPTKIYSTENFDLRGYQSVFGELPLDRIIFIIRDYRHWLSSSLKVGGFLGRPESTSQSPAMKRFGYLDWFCGSMCRVEMYKQYLREILGYTNYLNREITVIDFDSWVASDEYRESLPVGNVAIADKPSTHCGGSSFGGGDVRDRYSGMKKQVDEFIDDEIVKLYNEYSNNPTFCIDHK